MIAAAFHSSDLNVNMRCGETRYNNIPQWWILDLSTFVRGMPSRAMSPAAKADKAATTKAGELPPPNN